MLWDLQKPLSFNTNLLRTICNALNSKFDPWIHNVGLTWGWLDMQILGPTSDWLNNLHFQKILRGLMCIGKVKECCNHVPNIWLSWLRGGVARNLTHFRDLPENYGEARALKEWSPGGRHQHHLGTCCKYISSGPSWSSESKTLEVGAQQSGS